MRKVYGNDIYGNDIYGNDIYGNDMYGNDKSHPALIAGGRPLAGRPSGR